MKFIELELKKSWSSNDTETSACRYLINLSKMLKAYFCKNTSHIPAVIVTDIKSIYDRLNCKRNACTHIYTHITLKEFTGTNSKAKPIQQKSGSLCTKW